MIKNSKTSMKLASDTARQPHWLKQKAKLIHNARETSSVRLCEENADPTLATGMTAAINMIETKLT